MSDVNSWYNSFVLTFRKRMSGGVEFVANYTLAKATDGGQVPGQFGTFNGTDTPIDPYNRKLEYGRSDLDQRHRFVGNVVWIPQFTRKISNPTLRYLLDGYALSSIVTIAAGQPVTGTISGNPAGAIAGGPTGGAVNNSGTATGGRSPGLPRNLYTGPGMGDVDLRISREFRLHGAREALPAGRGLQPLQPHQRLHREHAAVHLHRSGCGCLRRACERLHGAGLLIPDSERHEQQFIRGSSTSDLREDYVLVGQASRPVFFP